MKVLVADDAAVPRRLLERHLTRWGYDVAAVCTGTEAWEVLQAEGAPRLALLDWMMPGMDGVDVCRQVRNRATGPYVYILLLTSRDTKVDVIEGLESGADDYLTKPFHPEELKARLRVGQRILDLEDSLVAAREVLQFKATHDALTGLWNRAAILDVLPRELPRGRREQSGVGILICDLDHFKSINDNYGHPIGDDVLREAARRLAASVRVYDTVGRYGGEEFLIVMPGCDGASTRDRAEQIRAAISDQAIQCGELSIPVTLSVGAVSSSDFWELSPEALLRAADAALYRAKEAGRNRVELALPENVSAPTPETLPAPVPAEAEQH